MSGHTAMRFEVLGPLRVHQGDDLLALGGSKPRALLGILLLHPGEPVGVEELTEALWDGEPPPSSASNVRIYVRRLRRALAPPGGGDGGVRVETSPPGYLVRVEPGELDLLDFRALDQQAREARVRGETGTAAALWRQALDLWRGRALADVRGGPRLSAAVVRLAEHRLRVAEAWIDAQLELGAHAELVGELRGLVAADPLHEPLWARLMVGLHRSGRTADALAAYGQAREHLVAELGVEPGQQLQRIQRAILAGDAAVSLDEPPPGTAPPRHAREPSTSPPARAAERPPAVPEVSPYQGLMPFETADAAWFFGRERLVAELVAYLSSQVLPGTAGQPSLVAVVGPSGSGKSSLLRAGLLPALAAGALPAARDWPTVLITPGAEPLAALSKAVASFSRPGTTWPEPDLRTDPRAFADLVRQALGRSGGRPEERPGEQPGGPRVMLIVDQLEELFTLCRDKRERQAFVTALCGAAGATALPGGADPAEPGPAVVVLGLRADFYGHAIAYPELLPALTGSQVVVGPMTEAELRHAIQRPAARAGLTLEPGLVEVLLADLGLDPEGGSHPEPGSLPLLSHALLATWQHRDGDRLTVAGYRTAGGMHGAIAATAETVYERLDPREQAIVRQLFRRLVALGEGTEDARRRIRHDELLDGRAQADADAARAILDTLVQARLIVLGADTIEVAHEALISHWPRLREWLTTDREGLRTHRQLTEAAQEWVALGRDPGALYRGARLAAARQWAEHDDHRADLNALERAFLDASVELETSEGTAVRRRAVRSRQVVAAILTLVLLATVGGAFALRESRRNAEQERIARSQDLAQRALSLPGSRRSTAMLLAVEAHRTAPTPQARGALTALTPEHGYVDTLATPGSTVSDLAFSPDGGTLAAADSDGGITLWDLPQRTQRATLPAQAGASAIAFSPDGELLASGGEDGRLVLWDPAEERRLAEVRTEAVINTVAFSPDGRTLATGSGDGAVVLWDTATQASLGTLVSGGPQVNSVAFSPDGSVLATGVGRAGDQDGAVELWDPAGQTRVATLGETGDAVTSLAFSADGSSLAVGRDTVFGQPVEVWDVQARSLAAAPPDPVAPDSVAFSPDGGTLAVGTAGGQEAMLWDLSGMPERVPPRMYVGVPAGTVAFSPDGELLAAADATDGNAITLLDPSTPQIISDYWIDQLDFSPDGTRFATSDARHRIDLWDTSANEQVATLDTTGGQISYPAGDLVFSPDGESLAWSGWSDVTVWRPREDAVTTLEGQDRPPDSIIEEFESLQQLAGIEGFESLGFSADGARLFAADTYHDTLSVWDVDDGTRTDEPVPQLARATLGPDGRVLATTTEDGVVTLWDFPGLTRPEVLLEPQAPGPNPPVVNFSADGGSLVIAEARTVTLWDLEERTRQTSFTETFEPQGVGILPDNRTVILVGPNNDGRQQVALWDLPTGVRTATLEDNGLYRAMVSDHAGARLAASTKGGVRFWNLNPQQSTAHICAALNRSLTRSEWTEFLPNQPYRPTCA